MLSDDVTGTKEIYTGTYNLTIVGGGPTARHISLFDENEKHLYNHARG